jgi:hypothetical protein
MIGYVLELKRIFLVLASLAFLLGCGGTEEETKGRDEVQQVNKSLQDDASNLISFEGEMFSIPSPVQTASLIKKIGFEYDGSLTRPVESASNFSTTFKKALNLGIYGADFAYVAYYSMDEPSLQYIKAIQELIEDLDLSAAIDEQLAEDITENIGNPDSIIYLSSIMFRTTNNYLKNNDRNEVASLILTGGFIESLYFFANLASIDKTGQVAQRIGEEKKTVETLYRILSNYDGEDFAELNAQIKTLVDAFEEVDIQYKFNRPQTDPVKKVTRITSTTEITISPETIQTILERTSNVRNTIIL